MVMVANRPYRKTNPRTIRGARRKGWYVVSVPDNIMEKFNTSWMGLEMWAVHKTKGNFVTSFMLREFAFEKTEDASWFTMKWCI
jgi:hypothetical protein